MDKITCLGRLQRTNWVQFDFYHAESADSSSYYKMQTSYTRIDCTASPDVPAPSEDDFSQWVEDTIWKLDPFKKKGWLVEFTEMGERFLLLCPACYASDEALVANGHIPYEPIRAGILAEHRSFNEEYYSDHWSPADERAMRDSMHKEYPQTNEDGEPIF
tara:strand:- start:52 stop:531 length:480 start_codon:yes stop_codon:yes gene_type:complete